MSIPTPNSQVKVGVGLLAFVTLIAIVAGVVASKDHNVSVPMIVAGPLVLAAFLWFSRNSEENGIIVSVGIIAAVLLIGFGAI